MRALAFAPRPAAIVRWREAPSRALRLPRVPRLSLPGWSTTVLTRSVKGLVAALLAWQAASWWLPGQQQYLAVATALVMVNAPTIYRSVTQALRSVAARAGGLSLAVAVVWLLGPAAGSVAAIPAIALVAGGRRGSDSRLQIASTATLTLAAATAVPVGHVVTLTLATLTGAAAGIAVNALILPPVHLRASDTSVRELASAMGELLGDMGRGLRERQHTDRAHQWLERSRHLDDLALQAQEDVRQSQESLRWNTRCIVHGQQKPTDHGEALRALHRVSFQVRGIARTLADSVDDHAGHGLNRLFLDRYAATLETAERAMESFAAPGHAAGPDLDSLCGPLRRAIDDATTWHRTMTDEIRHGTLAEPGAWHVYGSLITDIERLLADLERANRLTPTTPGPRPS
ncbi:aromatic acid exporter family protein [Kitasatospora sp. NPDC048286]|uniref:FUSC family protein n=1 Tax=unclassified Kitasatospora TaxID=2633591 RepID=UPI00371B6A69